MQLRPRRRSCRYANTLLLNVHLLQDVCLLIMIQDTFIAFMFYILVFTRIHCILLYFVTVSMCVCNVEIKRYLFTYLLTTAAILSRYRPRCFAVICSACITGIMPGGSGLPCSVFRHAHSVVSACYSGSSTAA